MDEAMNNRWWSLHIEADVEPAPEEALEDLLEVLPDLGGSSPALSWRGDELSLWLSVPAQDPLIAIHNGLVVFSEATDKLGIVIREIVRAEAVTHERLEREHEEEPDQYVGVSEIAAMLAVSKQRVSELRVRADFPAPVAELAAGPVWRESSLRRFVAEWPRRPGRPGTLLQALEDLHARHELLATENLTDKQRWLLDLVASGASFTDVAEQLGVTAEAVRSQLRRTMEKLRQSVDQQERSERSSRW
jgi:DNA-binding CsgD family transcriptional regulator